MSNKIQIKRGLKANLPILDAGEPAFTTDTKEFFVGDGKSNIEFAKQADLEVIDNQVSDLNFQTAGGTGTAITLKINQTMANGLAVTFIASTNNSGAATNINGKPLYKPNTKTVPNLIAGKAYTVWYNSTSDCFFIKASAEGNTIAAHVLAGDTFSNDNDTGLVGSLDLSNLVSGNIRSGVTINGVSGKSTVVDTADAVLDPQYLLNGYSGYDDGVKKNGSMTNLGSSQTATDTWTDGGGTLVFRVPSTGAFTGVVNGYKPEVNKWDGNFVAANIVNGVPIFGLMGSGSPSGFKNYTKGTITANGYKASTYTVTLGFQPYIVVGVMWGTGSGSNHSPSMCMAWLRPNDYNNPYFPYNGNVSDFYESSTNAQVTISGTTLTFTEKINWASAYFTWEAWG
ncbi:hypothetical protein [Clostridium sp. BL-8]|uniref:hyaluronate lyase N-terminal domain-containing protein n=1 Tax=Clostridium sp. BL-8 TaxID=349938 RepID=UPI00098C8381|nr:hypothetical protein [Clostridium sp. BL-8]OOM69664.1 hypothetical protein CLOBL_51850 [Clostridium sp. BL-8]